MNYKQIILIVAVSIAALQTWHHLPSREQPDSPRRERAETSGDADLRRAFEQRQSNVQVQGSGTVLRLLSDDSRGSRHQRFLLQLESGQTLLVAHNIDLAPRIDALKPGDRVRFQGEYEWNDKGGVLHWTHHDPDGSHPGGWLEHEGRRYE